MALVELVDAVRSRFAERGHTEVWIVDGIESRNSQGNFGTGSTNRVAFIPAASPMSIVPPTFIGEGDDDKRQLWNVMVALDVCVAAYDADHPSRDFAHRARCFDIFEIVAQEVHRFYHGACEWTGARWEDARKHGRHGAELVATLVVNVPIFDVEWATGTPAAVPPTPKQP